MRIKCNLKNILKEQEKSMYWLQKETGVGYQNLQDYRDDKKKRYDGAVVSKICKALKCRLEELLELDFTKIK